MKILKNTLLILAASFLVIACGDDSSPTGNGNGDGNIEIKPGSYWIFESFDLDYAGNAVDSTMTLDSSYVIDEITAYNNTWFPYVTDADYQALLGEVESDTMLVRSVEDRIYSILDMEMGDMLGEGGNFAPEALIADWDATNTWIATEIDTTILLDLGENGQFNVAAEMMVKVTPGAESNMTVDGESIAVKEFIINTEMDINAMIMTISIESSSHYYISKGKLIMSIKDDPAITSFTMIGEAPSKDTMPGSESNVIRYHIAD